MTYEQELQFIIDKMDGLNEDTWEEISEYLHYQYSPVTLRKSLAGRYGGKAVYEYFKQKEQQDIDVDSLLEIQEARDELYKERVRLQDIQREKRNNLREEARFENLVELTKDLLQNYKPIDLKPLMGTSKINDYIPTILQLSDWHLGAKIDNQWNYYDVEEAKRRAAIITRKAISKCRWANTTDLVIEIGGDMVHGIINISNRVDSEENVLESCFIVAELLSQCIAEIQNALFDQLKSLKVYTVLGNHGRLTSNKKDCNTGENFEMIIPRVMKLRLPNVTIVDSKGLDFLKYNLGEKVICLSHGNNDKINNIIGDFSKMYKVVPDEVHIGHWHEYADKGDCNSFITINGCLDGADDYALTLRKVSKPSQNIIIYDTDGDRNVCSLIAE